MSEPSLFDLNERQRAMLAEMGVRVWWPQRHQAAPPVGAMVVPIVPTSPAVLAPAPHQPSGTVPPPAAPFAAHAQTNARAKVQAHAQAHAQANDQANAKAHVQPLATAFKPLPSGLADMAWPELQQAVQECQSCGLCAGRKTPMPSTGQGPAPWMVVCDLPTETDDQQGQLFTGPEGVLLDNMLKAVGVRRQGLSTAVSGAKVQPEALLTSAVKCRPPQGRNPEATELAVCAAYLSRQVALAQPKVILAMGRFAIQSLLGSTEPTGKLRGRLHAYKGVPVVVTYPPTSLLRSAPDKAKAWADLVLALSVAKN